ncbi:MAG: hypothetical protein Fur0025_14260 [Oscillatoriaceae cyanobacterium]
MREKKWIPVVVLVMGATPGCAYLRQQIIPAPAAEITPEPENLSSDFERVSESGGAELYHKDGDYVQVIDLSKGATIQLRNGYVTDPGSGKGAYGGNDPVLTRQTLNEAWAEFSGANPKGFCLTNGQFFRNDRASATATALAFPVKVKGTILTDGYAGDGEYPTEKMMLELWPDQATIKDFNPTSFYSSKALEVIVGLKQDADKQVETITGRTFVGVKDSNGDGIRETVLIFNSAEATQPHAAEVLRYFGAGEVMMLDGGGSTQLICQGKTYIPSDRTIPQTIGVVSAP